MKNFLRKCPFISALLISGIFVILTFALSKFLGVEWLAESTAFASADTDMTENTIVGSDMALEMAKENAADESAMAIADSESGGADDLTFAESETDVEGEQSAPASEVSGGANASNGTKTPGEANMPNGSKTPGEANMPSGSKTSGGANVSNGSKTPGEANMPNGSKTSGGANMSNGSKTSGGANVYSGSKTSGGVNVSSGSEGDIKETGKETGLRGKTPEGNSEVDPAKEENNKKQAGGFSREPGDGEADRENAAEDDVEHPIGVTEFIYYEPVEVDSRYYEDPGKRPLTTNYPYSTVEKDYFDDAAFIGDSRMLGLFDYAGFDSADFFCDNGFCVYKWGKNGTVTYQNEHRKVNLMEALSEKQYKKVYLMIGMNDCGFGNSVTFKQGLSTMLEAITERQPEAIIYLMANMYITREKEDGVFNNVHINDKNARIAECADGERSFYLDYNSLYLDEDGYLKSELSFDGVHLYGTQYTPWIDFLLSHAVVREE